MAHCEAEFALKIARAYASRLDAELLGCWTKNDIIYVELRPYDTPAGVITWQTIEHKL